MRSRRRRALLPLRATPRVAWPPFFRPAHAAGCAAAEAARRAMEQGSKGPRGRVHVGRRQSRKPCLPSSRGGSVTTAFRHGSWLDASTINVRRLPRNHGRRRVLHLSASIRCFTFAAAPRPNPKRPVRRPAARAIRRVRRSPLAARCSLLAARATKHHARRRCGPRRAHAADRPPRSFRSAHRLARDSCPLARARPRSRTGG